MPFRASFDCLWCGRRWETRAGTDLEGWAQLCPECLGKAGDNAFLRTRLRAAIGERGGSSAVGSGPGPTAPGSGVSFDGLADRTAPAGAVIDRIPARETPRLGDRPSDDWYLRRGAFAEGPIQDAAWQAELDAAGRWLDSLPLGGRIVELQAGSGWWSPLLAEKGELSVYDTDEAALDAARDRLVAHGLRAHLHVRDPWAPADRRVDAVFTAFWLSRVPRGRLDAFLAVTRGWLRPGGQLLAIDLAVQRTGGAADAAPAGTHSGAAAPRLAVDHLRAALLRAGFVAVDVSTTGQRFILARAST